MLKIERNILTEERRKLKRGSRDGNNLLTISLEKRRRTPVRKNSIRTLSKIKEKEADKLAISMSLDELLEASKILDMRLRGEKTSFTGSPKVERYVNEVLWLNNRSSTRSVAKKVQQSLMLHIVNENKKTTNVKEAKCIYKAFMEENKSVELD